MKFIDQDHKSKFLKLIKEDQVSNDDINRISLFYILSSHQELYTKIRKIYNFEDHTIELDGLDKLHLSSAAHNMLQLGFKLFAGSCREYKDVSHLFSKLDIEDFEVCMYAVRIILGNVELESFE